MLRAIMYFLLWKWEKKQLGTPVANTREGQGYLTSSPSLSSVPKYLSVWALPQQCPAQAAANAWHALGSRKYALTPSTAMTSRHQQESPVAKMLQSCSSESRGGVSREGSWSRKVCSAQNAGSHSPLPPGSEHQALEGRLCAPEGVFYTKMV